MSEHIERPAALNYTVINGSGTVESRRAISEAHDSAFGFYKDLVRTRWDKQSAFDAAVCTLKASLVYIINAQAEDMEECEP